MKNADNIGARERLHLSVSATGDASSAGNRIGSFGRNAVSKQVTPLKESTNFPDKNTLAMSCHVTCQIEQSYPLFRKPTAQRGLAPRFHPPVGRKLDGRSSSLARARSSHSGLWLKTASASKLHFRLGQNADRFRISSGNLT